MSFKKFNEMELALLSAIASMTKEDAGNITVEKGDYTPITMEDYNSIPSYLSKPNAVRHAVRRKATFKKKEERKNLAREVGYSMSTEDNSKKVKDLLSANHTDRKYFRGEKVEQKYMTVQKEMDLMEQENREKAREDMMEYHNSILGSIGQDIDTLNMDLKSSEHRIEDLEAEYKELEEALTLVAEKLKNAQLRKNGIQAALVQNKSDFATLSANFEKERIRRFGW